MRRVLVLRPEPGAGATVSRAAAFGLEAVAAPLFTIQPIAWSPPTERPDALMLTSAHAIRHAGPALMLHRALPAYAVGSATAEAAVSAGFPDVRIGPSDAAALLAMMARDGIRSALHVAGREHKEADHPMVRVTRRVVYGADPVDALPDAARAALPDGAMALLHSPRAAALFGELVGDHTGIAIAAISPAAAEAAGGGWRAVVIAERPSDASLLAAAATFLAG